MTEVRGELCAATVSLHQTHWGIPTEPSFLPRVAAICQRARGAEANHPHTSLVAGCRPSNLGPLPRGEGVMPTPVAIVTAEQAHWEKLSRIILSCGLRPVRCETLAAATTLSAQQRFENLPFATTNCRMAISGN